MESLSRSRRRIMLPMMSMIRPLAPETITHFPDLSGSVLPRKPAILAAWLITATCRFLSRQSAPAARRVSDCRSLAYAPSTQCIDCSPHARRRQSQSGRQSSRQTSLPICRSRCPSWTLSSNCWEMIWHRSFKARAFELRHPVEPVQNGSEKHPEPLHPPQAPIASIPSRRR